MRIIEGNQDEDLEPGERKRKRITGSRLVGRNKDDLWEWKEEEVVRRPRTLASRMRRRTRRTKTDIAVMRYSPGYVIADADEGEGGGGIPRAPL